MKSNVVHFGVTVSSFRKLYFASKIAHLINIVVMITRSYVQTILALVLGFFIMRAWLLQKETLNETIQMIQSCEQEERGWHSE